MRLQFPQAPESIFAVGFALKDLGLQVLYSQREGLQGFALKDLGLLLYSQREGALSLCCLINSDFPHQVRANAGQAHFFPKAENPVLIAPRVFVRQDLDSGELGSHFLFVPQVKVGGI